MHAAAAAEDSASVCLFGLAAFEGWKERERGRGGMDGLIMQTHREERREGEHRVASRSASILGETWQSLACHIFS